MQANLQRAALAGIAQGLQPRGYPQQRGYPKRVMSPQMGYSQQIHSQGYPVGYMPQGGYSQMMGGGYGRDHGFTLYPRR